MRSLYLLLALFCCTSLFAQPILSYQEVANGFEKPVDIVSAGDERLFIVEQEGVIHILDENYNVLSTPFLDIDPRVNSGANERGLLGMAFHPDYADNGYFFVNYTRGDGSTVIARFSVDAGNANIADENSEKIILVISQPFSNHNAGDLAFGPDGYLYIGTGDGGSGGDPGNRSQNRQQLLGKMLRIDINTDDDTPYAIPEDNPFALDDFTLDEIWAIGLRNPWRYSFDRETGDLWIADVGQNAWEEIDFQPASSQGGENYGWRCYEGLETYNSNGCNIGSELREPVHVYESNSTVGCSVTGGFVYRGSAYPELVGHYIFADYCSGNIWTLDTENGNTLTEPFDFFNYELSTFGEDQDGELYFAAHGQGRIYRLIDACSGFSINAEVTNETCAGDEDGTINITTEGGTAPFSFNWTPDGLPTGQSQSNLPAESYQSFVTDANGCMRAIQVEITNGSPEPVEVMLSPEGDSLFIQPTTADIQWYVSGEPVAGAVETVFPLADAVGGSYYVVLTNPASNCTFTSDPLIVDQVFALPGLEMWQLSPNPTDGRLLLEMAFSSPAELKVTILDVLGRELKSYNWAPSDTYRHEFQLDSWPAGTYYLRLTREGKTGSVPFQLY